MARKKKKSVEAIPSIYLEPGTLDRRTCLACEHMDLEVTYEQDGGCGCCSYTTGEAQVRCFKHKFIVLTKYSIESPSTDLRAALRTATTCDEFSPLESLTEEELDIYGCKRTS